MSLKHFVVIAALCPVGGFAAAKMGADDTDVVSLALVAALAGTAGLLVRELQAREDE